VSALGQKADICKKKAFLLTPKKDMCGATGDVRYGPIAANASRHFPVFDVVKGADLAAPFFSGDSQRPVSSNGDDKLKPSAFARPNLFPGGLRNAVIQK
jgi:hypothetical protein